MFPHHSGFSLRLCLLTVGTLFGSGGSLHAQEPPTPPAAPAPAAAPDWKTLKAAYDYTPNPALKVTEEARSDPDYLRLHLTFTNKERQKVPGLFLRPKADGVYPCVLLLHGWTSDKETMVNGFGKALAAQGIASLALDADQHGERKGMGARDMTTFLTVQKITLLDYRVALDYLLTRKDVDRKHLGLLGYSMGAMMGAILGGVDERIGAFVLCVGGDMVRPNISRAPVAARPLLEAVSPSYYVGHISPRPLLMINGRQDVVVNADASKLLQTAAREPKEILWVDSGHIIPADAARKGTDWLAAKLKQH